jgi:hypothetical protein
MIQFKNLIRRTTTGLQIPSLRVNYVQGEDTRGIQAPTLQGRYCLLPWDLARDQLASASEDRARCEIRGGTLDIGTDILFSPTLHRNLSETYNCFLKLKVVRFV